MASLLLTKRILSPFALNPSRIFKYYTSFLEPFKSIGRENEQCKPTVCNNSTSKPTQHPCGVKLPTLIPTGNNNHLEGFSIELVDPDIWPQALNVMGNKTGDRSESFKENEVLDEMPSSVPEVGESPDFDEIEDLRLRKKLFYKLDRDSKEFEEYNLNFHRKKPLKKDREKPTKTEMKKECKKPEQPTKSEAKKEHNGLDKSNQVAKQKSKASSPPLDCHKPNGSSKELSMEGKRVRTPTFNQLTGAYHLPFCLDIFITKGSVRASIIHRVTSKVVAVAHSISKDLKFDLNSRKDAKACAAVGGVLAQRAIEDDIHNVVYTPRKGDKIEGKLQVVLQSIIDNGIDVKVKLKQKRYVKVCL